MLTAIRPALVLLALFTILCGVAYPLVVTGIAQVAMSDKANGSLVKNAQGTVVGSALIGQAFSDPAHFWGRPSATATVPNNASASSGSNLGPLNPALVDAVKPRVQALADADAKAGVTRAADAHGDPPKVPVDLVTTSGSGLDPDITPAAALWQVPRVAHVRGAPEEQVRALVDAHTVGRTLGLFGEPRVNVLALNLALDAKWPAPAAAPPAAAPAAPVDGVPSTPKQEGAP